MKDHTGLPLAPWSGPRYAKDANGCWIWQLSCNSTGYGLLWHPGRRRLLLAHRWMYEHDYGPIPAGMQVHHRCKVRACVNPEHLEAVTPREHYKLTHPDRKRIDSGPEPPQVRQVDPTDCILWTGSRDRDGYGHKSFKGRTVFVHRWAYEQRFGAIPDGLQIDHLCRNRACYNPEHLEAVTRQENIRRQKWSETCQRGHPWTPENTLWEKDGRRKCRTCRLVAMGRYEQRRQERKQQSKSS